MTIPNYAPQKKPPLQPPNNDIINTPAAIIVTIFTNIFNFIFLI